MADQQDEEYGQEAFDEFSEEEEAEGGKGREGPTPPRPLNEDHPYLQDEQRQQQQQQQQHQGTRRGEVAKEWMRRRPPGHDEEEEEEDDDEEDLEGESMEGDAGLSCLMPQAMRRANRTTAVSPALSSAPSVRAMKAEGNPHLQSQLEGGLDLHHFHLFGAR